MEGSMKLKNSCNFSTLLLNCYNFLFFSLCSWSDFSVLKQLFEAVAVTQVCSLDKVAMFQFVLLSFKLNPLETCWLFL